jgi:hypothetical protein
MRTSPASIFLPRPPREREHRSMASPPPPPRPKDACHHLIPTARPLRWYGGEAAPAAAMPDGHTSTQVQTHAGRCDTGGRARKRPRRSAAADRKRPCLARLPGERHVLMPGSPREPGRSTARAGPGWRPHSVGGGAAPRSCNHHPSALERAEADCYTDRPSSQRRGAAQPRRIRRQQVQLEASPMRGEGGRAVGRG